MIIVAIFAPIVFLSAFFTVAFFFSGALQKGDGPMMKLWGIVLVAMLVFVVGSLVVSQQLSLHF